MILLMGYIISVSNQKGGVGKTTATFNLAAALVKKGASVLLIDNDPQANLTSYAASEIPESQLSLDEVYVSKRPLELSCLQAFKINSHLSLIPADSLLSGVEYYLMAKPHRETVLRQALVKLKDHFDYILIDNPPTLNLLSINGLVAADFVLVPTHTEYFSLEGLSQLLSTVQDLKKYNPELKVLGVFASLFDERRKLNKDSLVALQESLGKMVMSTKIHNSVKIPESAGFAKSVLDYAPVSSVSMDYQNLADEVVSRCQNQN